MSLLILIPVLEGEKELMLWDTPKSTVNPQNSIVRRRIDSGIRNIADNQLVRYPKSQDKPATKVVQTPLLGNSIVGFKEALAFSESGGNYSAVNTLGYVGKYQFGAGTLEVLGIFEVERFLQDAALQERIFLAHLARNKWLLRRELSKFKNQEVNGLEITESGVLAAAHLAGAGNVKKYLRSGGRFDVVDAYGTRLSEYLKEFSGFDLSQIPAIRKPIL